MPLKSQAALFLTRWLFRRHLEALSCPLLSGKLGTLFYSFPYLSNHFYSFVLENDFPHILMLTLILLLILLVHRLIVRSRHRHVYLVDFACLRPPSSLRVPFSCLMEHLSMIDCFDEDSIGFMSKVVSSSGIGEETYFPPSLRYIPPKTEFQESIKEAHMLLFSVMDDLFAKTNVCPIDIDILIVNCSGFCPSPSLSSIVVNHYSMREDIKTFNLSGMGCSASIVGVDIARGLFKVHPNSYAVVLSTEILSTGWYAGKDRRKLLLNCIFRMGSAAVLLTNRKEAKKIKPKYRLVRTVRTQHAFDDVAYKSAVREEDSQGITGFSIERDLLKVARETLKAHIVTLGSSILPLTERLRYLFHSLLGTIVTFKTSYVPKFGSAIHHYCMPTSGMTVIKEIGKGLGLTDGDMEAAMATFHRFGNQSSSSMWYQLAYMEKKGRVRKGEKVWQLGMGSGPKCNTAVWECLRDVTDRGRGGNVKGAWDDCIFRYPTVVGSET